jgi:hypothetical protein
MKNVDILGIRVFTTPEVSWMWSGSIISASEVLCSDFTRSRFRSAPRYSSRRHKIVILMVVNGG